MFDNQVISLNNVLIGLESALKLEIDPEADTQRTIDKAVENLENVYAVKFTTDIFTLMQETQLQSDNLQLLMRDIQQALCTLSFFVQLKLFHKNVPITLADVNYIGYSSKELITVLRYLQDEDLYAQKADENITPLYGALNTISMCSTKRIFIIMLMLHRLGISEGVAIVAQLLFLGGLVQ